jgi:hypothetical protein
MKTEPHTPTIIHRHMKFRELLFLKFNYTALKIDHKISQNFKKPLVEQFSFNLFYFYYNLVKIEPHLPIYMCRPVQFRELNLYNSENWSQNVAKS